MTDETTSDEAVTDPNLWHLVCRTRLGRVSMIKNLDTRTARATYRQLRPDEHPKKYIYPEDGQDLRQGGFGGFRTYGPTDDWLDAVSVIGPPGVKLNPWKGIQPQVVDLRPSDWEVADRKARVEKFGEQKAAAKKAADALGLPDWIAKDARLNDSPCRCSNCSAMQQRGALMSFIPDSARVGDDLEAMRQITLSGNWSGSGWCGKCLAKLAGGRKIKPIADPVPRKRWAGIF